MPHSVIQTWFILSLYKYESHKFKLDRDRGSLLANNREVVANNEIQWVFEQFQQGQNTFRDYTHEEDKLDYTWSVIRRSRVQLMKLATGDDFLHASFSIWHRWKRRVSANVDFSIADSLQQFVSSQLHADTAAGSRVWYKRFFFTSLKGGSSDKCQYWAGRGSITWFWQLKSVRACWILLRVVASVSIWT